MRTSSNPRSNTPIWERNAMREKQKEARLERLRKASEEQSLKECNFAPSISEKSRRLASSLQTEYKKSSVTSAHSGSHGHSTAREVFEEVFQGSNVKDSGTAVRRESNVSFIDVDPVPAPPPPPANPPPAWAKRVSAGHLTTSPHAEPYRSDRFHFAPSSPSGPWLNRSIQPLDVPPYLNRSQSTDFTDSKKINLREKLRNDSLNAAQTMRTVSHAFRRNSTDSTDSGANTRTIQFVEPEKRSEQSSSEKQTLRKKFDTSSPSGRSVDSLLADMSLSSDSSESDAMENSTDVGLSRHDLRVIEGQRERWIAEKQHIEKNTQSLVEDLEIVIQDKDEVIRSLQHALENEVHNAQEHIEAMRKQHETEIDELKAQLLKQSHRFSPSKQSDAHFLSGLHSTVLSNPKYRDEMGELDALLEMEKMESMKELEVLQQELKEMKEKVAKYEAELSEANEKQRSMDLLYKSNASASIDFHTSKQQSLIFANVASLAVACDLATSVIQRESGAISVQEFLSITLSSLRILDSTDPETGRTNASAVPLKGDQELLTLPESLSPLKSMLDVLRQKFASNTEEIENLKKDNVELEKRVNDSAVNALHSSQSFRTEKQALESEYKDKVEKLQQENDSLKARLADYEQEREEWLEQLEGENVQLSATIEETKNAREKLVSEMTALAAERKILNEERLAFQAQERILLDAIQQAGVTLPASYVLSKNSTALNAPSVSSNPTSSSTADNQPSAASFSQASQVQPFAQLYVPSIAQPVQQPVSHYVQHSPLVASQSTMTPLAILMNTSTTTTNNNNNSNYVPGAVGNNPVSYPLSVSHPHSSMHSHTHAFNYPSQEMCTSPGRSISNPVHAYSQPPVSRPAPTPPTHVAQALTTTATNSGSGSRSMVQRLLNANDPHRSLSASTSHFSSSSSGIQWSTPSRGAPDSLAHSLAMSTHGFQGSLPPAPPNSLPAFMYSTPSRM